MRIGIDAHMLGDKSGGNESYYSGILEAFNTDDDNEYFLFVKRDFDASAFWKKFKVVYFKSKSSFVRNYLELTYLCIRYRLDVLHTQYYIPFIRPCTVVVTIHDICFEHFDNIFNRGEYIRNKLLIPYAAKKASKIITVSEFSKQDIKNTYHISSDKIAVTYNAVSEEFRVLTEEEKKEANIRAKYGIADNPYLICVGNLQPRKNIPRLIDAFICFKRKENACVAKERYSVSSTKLVIVGKKAWLYEESLKAAAGNPDIIFTDYVDRNDLIALLNDAVGFLYPSLFEGFGIPPLEALSCGTKVAVSDIPVMHEVIGNAAIFFDPLDVDDMENAIEELLAQACDKTRSQDVKKEISNRFSWKDSAEVLHDVYMKTKN